MTVYGAGTATCDILIHNDTDSDNTYNGLMFKADSQNNNTRIKGAVFFERTGTRGTGTLHLCNDGVNDDGNVGLADSKLSINAAGIITTPNQPAFSVYAGANWSISINTPTRAHVNVEEFDIGNNFNSSTNRFTAPVAGRYLFAGAAQFGSQTSPHTNFYVNGSSRNDGWVDFGGAMSSTQTRVIDLGVNDYVELYVYVGANTTLTGARNRFSGYLIG